MMSQRQVEGVFVEHVLLNVTLWQPWAPGLQKSQSYPLKNLTSQSLQGPQRKVRVEGRGSTGTEEVRLLCGPPGTY